MFEPYGYGDVFRTGLREIVAVRSALTSLEAQLVIGARLLGYSWAVLAEDLELTPHGARKRHLGVDPLYARRLSPVSPRCSPSSPPRSAPERR